MFYFNKTAVTAVPACRIAGIRNQPVGRGIYRRTAGIRDINRVLRVQPAPVPTVLLRRKGKVATKAGEWNAAARSRKRCFLRFAVRNYYILSGLEIVNARQTIYGANALRVYAEGRSDSRYRVSGFCLVKNARNRQYCYFSVLRQSPAPHGGICP